MDMLRTRANMKIEAMLITFVLKVSILHQIIQSPSLYYQSIRLLFQASNLIHQTSYLHQKVLFPPFLLEADPFPQLFLILSIPTPPCLLY